MSGERTVWIPEAPKYPGCYAFDGGYTNATLDVYAALQFDTREACQTWCDAYNDVHPAVGGGKAWAPTEHMFVTLEGVP